MRIFESKLLGLPLLPLSWLYGSSVTARDAVYRTGLRRQKRVDAVVVSIGNITVGGTGKTPFTAWLARQLTEHGAKVGIVSRGYGRKSRGLLVVSDGQRILADVRQSGDEPQLLAHLTSGVPVLVDEDRARGCQEAVRRFSCQILLLDDAFQHRRVHRDMDIVLIHARRGFGNGYLLPAGPLREPLRALRRAGQIVLTRCSNLEEHARLVAAIHRHTAAPLSCADYTFTGLHSPSGTRAPTDWLRGRRVVAVAGIADPEGFFESLRGLGAELVHTLRFVDHHWYTERDVARIERLAGDVQAEAVVTTEKDLVRLGPLLGKDRDAWLALRVELQPRHVSREHWEAVIRELLAKIPVHTPA